MIVYLQENYLRSLNSWSKGRQSVLFTSPFYLSLLLSQVLTAHTSNYGTSKRYVPFTETNVKFVFNISFTSIAIAQREGSPRDRRRDRRPSDKVAAQRRLFLHSWKVAVDFIVLQVKLNVRWQKKSR